MKRQTLSVVLATFNEEKNIERCLESIKEIADEIIIVDGSSSDRTVEIAKRFGAKVKTTTNKPNFHINKQMAIDMAKSDWILQLDADERVSEELAEEIKSVVSGQSSKINGFWIPRKNFFLGRFLMKGGQYPDYTIRLYRKGKGNLPQKDVHEQAIVQGQVGHLSHPILHYPYENFSSYLSKWNRYNDFLSAQIKEEESSKNISLKSLDALLYLFVRPAHWLLMTFIRHKGFIDGWQGFVFSFFSALRYPVSYIKHIGYFKFSVLLILVFSIFLRFYNFNLRWSVSGDDSRDALVALEALKIGKWPMTGSFSSAGPFVFGGIFYWFIMISYLLLPFLINAPWIFTGIVGVLTVLIVIMVGREIGSKTFAVIIGLLAATSPQLVARSAILGQHTFISTFSILTVLFILLLWRTKNKLFAFLSGLAIGMAINFHYQALNLLIFFPALFFIPEFKIKEKLFSLFLMFFGLLVPLFPLLYWDSQQSFANTRNLIDYFLIGQERIYMPNSWKLFVFKYLPGYWSFVEGRYQIIALLSSILSLGVFAVMSVRKKISPKILFFGVIFILLLVLNRYYRGERSESYLLYFVPFILILVTWFSEQLIINKKNFVKTAGLIFLGITLIGNITGVIDIMNYKNLYPIFRRTADILYNKFPDSKFSIYDYKYLMYSASMPLSLIIDFDGKQDVRGKKLGLSCYGKNCPKQNLPIIITDPLLIVDLNNLPASNFEHEKKLWIGVNRENTYDDLTGWLLKHQLKSSFDLNRYIYDRLLK